MEHSSGVVMVNLGRLKVMKLHYGLVYGGLMACRRPLSGARFNHPDSNWQVTEQAPVCLLWLEIARTFQSQFSDVRREGQFTVHGYPKVVSSGRW